MSQSPKRETLLGDAISNWPSVHSDVLGELEAPPSYKATLNRAMTLFRSGEFEESAAEYQKAIKYSDKERVFGLYFLLGVALFRAKKIDEAIAAYHSAIQLTAPEDRLTRCMYIGHLGDAFAEDGQLDKAILAYQAAVESWPRHDWYHRLGHALIRDGRIADAISAFSVGIDKNPGSEPLIDGLNSALELMREEYFFVERAGASSYTDSMKKEDSLISELAKLRGISDPVDFARFKSDIDNWDKKKRPGPPSRAQEDFDRLKLIDFTSMKSLTPEQFTDAQRLVSADRALRDMGITARETKDAERVRAAARLIRRAQRHGEAPPSKRKRPRARPSGPSPH